MGTEEKLYEWTTYIVCPHGQAMSIKFQHYLNRYREDSITHKDFLDKSFVVYGTIRYKLISLEQAKTIEFTETDWFEASEMRGEDIKALASAI